MSVAHGVIKQAAYVVDDLDAAIMRWVEVVGGLQIELIAPHGEAPSIYRELPRGVHHLAMLSRDCLLEMIEGAAHGWDGQEPIRRLGP